MMATHKLSFIDANRNRLSHTRDVDAPDVFDFEGSLREALVFLATTKVWKFDMDNLEYVDAVPAFGYIDGREEDIEEIRKVALG